jgi:hypothetical protein
MHDDPFCEEHLDGFHWIHHSSISYIIFLVALDMGHLVLTIMQRTRL